MGLSLYAGVTLTKALFNAGSSSLPATWYVALYTAMPSGGTGGTEANYTGYARVALTNNTTDFAAVSSSTGQTSNAVQVTWPTNTGSPQTVVGFGFYDAATGGNLWMDQSFTTSQTVNTSTAPYASIGALAIAPIISP